MKAYWSAVSCAFFMFAGLRTSNLQAQESAIQPSVLHIQQTQTTSQGSQNGFPTFLAMYHVLDGAKSPAEALSLTGTISLKNYDPTFSEVLWILTYWQGKCPAHDITLSEAAILWSDILKNPSQSDSTFTVNLVFPHPLPMTGCVGLYYGGGPLFEGKATMSADLNLAYRPVTNSNPDTVLDLSGEYCFGQDWAARMPRRLTERASRFRSRCKLLGICWNCLETSATARLTGHRTSDRFRQANRGALGMTSTCSPEDAGYSRRTSIAKGSRIRRRYRLCTTGFPTMRCTSQAYPW